jgi:uncharacterized protein YlxP (DUF503 family)
MVIGLCTIDLHLPGANSLKDKRSVLKSVMRRVRNEFNVSIAEVDHQDAWRSAVIAVATVSSDRAYAHGLLTKVVDWIERTRLDAELVDYQIEML